MRPNPPKMVTVVLAVVLTAIGLVLVFVPDNQALLQDLLRAVSVPRDVQRTILELAADRMVAYLFLLVSPVLLIVGSLVRGV